LIKNCTIVSNSAPSAGAFYFEGSSQIENTIAAFNDGSAVECFEPPDMSCCDLYGNTGGDWTGHMAHLLGQDGNICEDPLLCDWPGGNYAIQYDSPCNPLNNPSCDLIGAGPIGCTPAWLPDPLQTPSAIALLPSVPNPFHHATKIRYFLHAGDVASPVSLRVHDPAGRLIQTLVDGVLPPGMHFVSWDGRTMAGGPAA
jgi:hypothetical protein